MSQSSQAAGHRVERQVTETVRRHAAEGRLPHDAGSLGLDPAECEALLREVGADHSSLESPRIEAEPAPLLQPLISMLWRHRATEGAWTRMMAGATGCACFGEHHLWQDLGLSGRSEVSALLARHFPELAAGNTRGLRWKRYLFLRLGDELGIDDLAPPRCDGCDDFRVCFGQAVNAAFVIVPQA